MVSWISGYNDHNHLLSVIVSFVVCSTCTIFMNYTVPYEIYHEQQWHKFNLELQNQWLIDVFLPPLLKIACLKVIFFQMPNIKNEFFKKFTSAIFLLTFITNWTEWTEWQELPLTTSLLIDVFVSPPTWSASPLLWFAMSHILIIGMLYSSASCWTPEKWGQGFILTATVTTFYIMGQP